MNTNLNILKDIHKIDPSPFLMYRIREKIEAARRNKISPPKVYAIAASILLLISLNIMAVSSSRSSDNSKDVLAVNKIDNFYND